VLVDAVDEGAVEIEQEPLGSIHVVMLWAEVPPRAGVVPSAVARSLQSARELLRSISRARPAPTGAP
jgi:hypothetical protein